MNRELILYYKEKMLTGGYKRIINAVENLLLRPNDQRLLMGEEKFNAYKIALEEILKEQYLNDKLNEYYNTYDKKIYSFCNFNNWLKGLY